MHDRISVNNLCFPGSPLATDIERWRSLGARRIGIQTAKMQAEGWDPSLESLRGSGFEVETIVHLNPNRFDDDAQIESFQKELSRTLAAANNRAHASGPSKSGVALPRLCVRSQ